MESSEAQQQQQQQGGQGLVDQLKQIIQPMEGYVPEVMIQQGTPPEAAEAGVAPGEGGGAGEGGEGGAEGMPTGPAEAVPLSIIQDKRPYACEVSGCNMKFKNPQTLKIHSKTHADAGVMPAQQGYGKAGKNKKVASRCPSCDKIFVGLYELRRHYGRKHSSGEKSFSCSKCPKRFFIEVDLRDHAKLCGEPFECTGCKLKFAFKCNLVSHRKTHPDCATVATGGVAGEAAGGGRGAEGAAAGGEADPLAWGPEAATL